MGLYLNNEQMRLLGEAQRVMLSPLESPTLDQWRSRVNGSLRRLLGCDRTCFLLQAPEEILCYSDDTDPQFMAALQYALDPGNPDPSDTYWQETNFARIQRGLTAWHEGMFSERRALERTRFHNEVHVPAGVRYMMGMSTYGEADEVSVSFGFLKRDAPFYSEAGVQLLGLLAPAFEAGVQMRRRVQALASSLDLMPDGALVVGADGRELFRNRALAALSPREAEVLPPAMLRLGQGLAFQRTGDSRASGATVSSAGVAYRLLAGRLAPEAFGEEAVLVLARLDSAAPVVISRLPGREEVQRSFGLTRREAEVAALMALGMTDRAISEHLFVSLNTARRHAETVLKKLGIHHRSAVALKLLDSSVSP